MKWVNHQVLTGVIVYAATDDMLLTIYSMAGAIFPDKVEGNPHAGNYWSWRSRHRGWSHWPLLYLGLIFFLSRLEEGQLTALPTADLTTIGIYICIGALLTPYQKVGVRLFKVGSVPEYLFTIAAVLLCYGLRTHFSFLSLLALRYEIEG